MESIEPAELQDFMNGDVQLADRVFAADHAVIEALAARIGGLTVTADAAIRVIKTLAESPGAANDIRRWATFIRFGETWKTKTPIRQIEVQYQVNCEETLVKVISRLSEIGDAIDGTIEIAEAEEMLEAIDRCQQDQRSQVDKEP